MAIKFLGLDQCFAEHKYILTDIYCEVGLSGQVVGGEHVSEFEDNCRNLASRKYAISTANASDGLFFALNALGIHHGDDVLTTAYSFHATAESILRAGATPIFVDVTDDYLIDLDKASSAITDQTKAIIIVNLFGNCINFDEVRHFADKHNIAIIEDAAQSLMASWDNIPSGKLGIASVYSFAPSKNIPSFSHGGCVLTDDFGLYNHITSQKLHGRQGTKHTMVGYNSIISAFEAAQLNYFFTLKHKWQAHRRGVASQYINGLAHLLQTPPTNDKVINGWHKFVIKTDKRDQLATFLNNHDIQVGIHYNTISPNEPVFNNTHSYDVATALSSISLSLPIYPELRDQEVQYIINTIQDFFTRS